MNNVEAIAHQAAAEHPDFVKIIIFHKRLKMDKVVVVLPDGSSVRAAESMKGLDLMDFGPKWPWYLPKWRWILDMQVNDPKLCEITKQV